MYNKNNVRKVNDKKVLHKVGKSWKVVSLALLMAIGGAAAATSVNANADNIYSQTISDLVTPQTGNTAAGNFANGTQSYGGVSASSSAVNYATAANSYYSGNNASAAEAYANAESNLATAKSNATEVNQVINLINNEYKAEVNSYKAASASASAAYVKDTKLASVYSSVAANPATASIIASLATKNSSQGMPDFYVDSVAATQEGYASNVASDEVSLNAAKTLSSLFMKLENVDPDVLSATASTASNSAALAATSADMAYNKASNGGTTKLDASAEASAAVKNADEATSYAYSAAQNASLYLDRADQQISSSSDQAIASASITANSVYAYSVISSAYNKDVSLAAKEILTNYSNFVKQSGTSDDALLHYGAAIASNNAPTTGVDATDSSATGVYDLKSAMSAALAGTETGYAAAADAAKASSAASSASSANASSAAAKKSAAKRATTRKARAKKSAAKRATTRKARAKKSAAKRATTRKARAKKLAAAKRAASRKSAAKARAKKAAAAIGSSVANNADSTLSSLSNSAAASGYVAATAVGKVDAARKLGFALPSVGQGYFISAVANGVAEKVAATLLGKFNKIAAANGVSKAKSGMSAKQLAAYVEEAANFNNSLAAVRHNIASAYASKVEGLVSANSSMTQTNAIANVFQSVIAGNQTLRGLNGELQTLGGTITAATNNPYSFATNVDTTYDNTAVADALLNDDVFNLDLASMAANSDAYDAALAAVSSAFTTVSNSAVVSGSANQLDTAFNSVVASDESALNSDNAVLSSYNAANDVDAVLASSYATSYASNAASDYAVDMSDAGSLGAISGAAGSANDALAKFYSTVAAQAGDKAATSTGVGFADSTKSGAYTEYNKALNAARYDYTYAVAYAKNVFNLTPHFLDVVKPSAIHTTVEFGKNGDKVVAYTHKGDRLTVKGVKMNSVGIVRLYVLDNSTKKSGFITGLIKENMAMQKDSNNYYTKAAYLQSTSTSENLNLNTIQGVNVYSDVNATKKVGSLKAGTPVYDVTVVPVNGDAEGFTRCAYTANGVTVYFTANTDYVNVIADNTNTNTPNININTNSNVPGFNGADYFNDNTNINF